MENQVYQLKFGGQQPACDYLVNQSKHILQQNSCILKMEITCSKMSKRTNN